MKTRLFCLYILAAFCFPAFAQDPVFFSTTQSLVYLNPSFAGSNGGIRDQLSYYNQWPNAGKASYVTSLNAFDAYIKPLKGGIAFSVLSDNGADGKYRATLASLAYAQHLSFSDNNLKIIPSVQATYGQRSLDRGRLTFGDVLDPRMGLVWNSPQVIPSATKTYLDLSGGLLVNYKKNLYAGVSVFHINQPDVGLMGVYNMPVNFTAHASYNLHTSDKTLFNFFIKYSVQGKYSFNQAGVNAVFFKHLVAGVGLLINPYSYDNGILLCAGYRNNFMAVTLSYDRSASESYFQQLASFPSYGLNLSYNLRNKDQRRQLTNFEAW